jgi:hypothetical protein
MGTPRAYFTATLLQNGKVLVAGGSSGGTNILSTCEIYDPTAYDSATGSLGSWSDAAEFAGNEVRETHTATLLRNGKVLVVGGDDTPDFLLSTSQLYDPTTGVWSAIPDVLQYARVNHAATLLADGKVLVTGGYGDDPQSVEIYDPSTNSWDLTDSMNTPRASHTATLLPDGRVLVVGGEAEISSLESAEIYDSTSASPNKWTEVAPLTDSDRTQHTATLLPDGKVLVVGGQGCVDHPECLQFSALKTAQIYDPELDTWTPADPMVTGRYGHSATLLPNGTVLVVGGRGEAGQPLDSAEVFDSATGHWADGGSFADARQIQTATLLPSGEVLVTGGTGEVGFLASAELFAPEPGVDSDLKPMLTGVTSLVCLGATQVIATGTNFQGLSESSGGNGGQNSSTNYPLLQIHAVDEKDYYLLSDPVSDPVDHSYGWSNTHFRSVVVASGAVPPGSAQARIIANGVASDPISVTVGPRTPAISGASSNACPSLSVELTTESGMADYQWYKAAAPIFGATVANYTATESGTYTVSYSDGCGTGTSVGKTVTLAPCLAPPETAPGDTPATAQTWSDNQTITWPVNPGATSGYHVYRGAKADLPNLLDSSVDSCTRATTPDASSNVATGIAEDPSGVTGQFYWYLVTGLNWTEGSAGNATAGERIVNSSGDCP